MKFNIAIFLIVISLAACKTEKEELNAQKIVDLAIKASGTENFKNSIISFSFRNKKYISERNCDRFVFSREQTDSINTIKDVYDTQGKLRRYINDTLITLADSTANKYAESINSVMYFVQLPYRLNDTAANKSYQGIDSINGKAYHKIAVDFDQQGGGTDFQDKYLYWFGTGDYKLDYLAYSFVVNGGGIRFREAYNARIIDGIRFVDYKNYKPETEGTKLENIVKAYQAEKLELLSNIENENINVEKYDNEC